METIWILYGIVFVIGGLYLGGIGVWGLISQRPLVLSARQMMWILLLLYVPQVIQSFIPLFAFRDSLNEMTIFLPCIQVLMMALLVFVFWRQMQGYTIFGVSEDTFRAGLFYALNKLNMPFQETLAKVKLTELNADLYAIIAEWMGTAQIRMKQPQHAQRTADIAKVMRDYYTNNQVKVNNTSYIVYLLLGLFLIVLVIGFSIFISSRL